MPHLMIDYSANVDGYVDMQEFCNTLRKAAIETGVFPMPGVRVRAVRADYTSIADGDAAHGYIDISVRLRSGRDLPTRQAATQHLFSAAKQYLEPAFATRSIALSLEMRDIDPELSPKHGTVRNHLNKASTHD